MATTPNYTLPLPEDATYVADTARIIRESNTKVDEVLDAQETRVVTAEQAAKDAARLVGTPPGNAIDAAIQPGGAAHKTLSYSTDMSQNPVLGLLHARLALCRSLPLHVVTAGSSTTSGYDQNPADRWVSTLLRSMQDSYAVGPGAETVPVSLTTTPSNVPGIHLHNAGISNTTSATYLSDDAVAKIGQINPAMITHMVGSNDARNGMTALEYRTNLTGWLDKIDAAVSGGHIHVLIHAHERIDANISARWAEYREVLRVIAAERHNVAFIDISRDFASLGIQDDDPLGMLKPDKIHLTALGHDHIAQALSEALRIPRKNTARLVNLSDTFSRPNGSLGTSDTGQVWAVPSGGMEIDAGRATATVGDTVALCESGLFDVDIAVRMTHAGITNSLAGMCLRSRDANNRLTFMINPGTSKDAAFHISIGGTTTQLARVVLPLGTGTFNIRCVAAGNILHGYVDNELVLTHRLSEAHMKALIGNTKTGFRAAVQIDSLTFDELRARAI